MITFHSQEIPEFVYIYQQRYRVRPYFEKPWQCFNCQGFGHNASDCRSKSRCVVCSGHHILGKCSSQNLSQDEKKNFPVKCVNCHGEHTASYGGCPNVKFAKKVQNVRTLSRLSYRDAVKEVQKTQAVSKTVGRNHNNPAISNSSKMTASISTQTENNNEPEYPSLIANMTLLMVKLFKSVMKSNEGIISNNTISKIVKDTIGITIPTSAYEDQQNQESNVCNDIVSNSNTPNISKDTILKDNTNKAKQSISGRSTVSTPKTTGNIAKNPYVQNNSQNSLPDTFDSHKIKRQISRNNKT